MTELLVQLVLAAARRAGLVVLVDPDGRAVGVVYRQRRRYVGSCRTPRAYRAWMP